MFIGTWTILDQIGDPNLYDERNLLPAFMSKFGYWTISVGTRFDEIWWVMIASYRQ